MNAEPEHKHLAQADRHIAELKKDIARQWQIIEELSMGGQPLHETISMLRLLKDHLRIMERHRQSILDELERRILQAESRGARAAANMYPASNRIHCQHAPGNEGWRCFVRGGPCHTI